MGACNRLRRYSMSRLKVASETSSSSRSTFTGTTRRSVKMLDLVDALGAVHRGCPPFGST